MKEKRDRKTRRIPEALGNRICGVWLYVAVLLADAGAHAALFITYGMSADVLPRLIFSFVFFIYPLCYLADVLWSLRPAVLGILSGRISVNRRYYMNTVREDCERDSLLPVTDLYGQHGRGRTLQGVQRERGQSGGLRRRSGSASRRKMHP